MSMPVGYDMPLTIVTGSCSYCPPSNPLQKSWSASSHDCTISVAFDGLPKPMPAALARTLYHRVELRVGVERRLARRPQVEEAERQEPLDPFRPDETRDELVQRAADGVLPRRRHKSGALAAARFLHRKPAGLYSMRDVIEAL